MGPTVVPKRRQEIYHNLEERGSQLLRGGSLQSHKGMKSLREKKDFLKIFLPHPRV